MFFARKPTGIVLLEREKLLLYPRGKTPPLAFTPEMVEYLEVRDAARLSAAVVDFANKNVLIGQRLLLMLDKTIVFQKAVNMTQVKDTAAAQADFESKVPFNPDDRQVVSLQQKDYQFMFGVNKALYGLVGGALQQAGAKVMAVVPAVAYGVTDSDKFTPAKLDQVIHASGLTQSVNFLERA